MKSSEGFVRMRTLQGVVLFIFLLIAGRLALSLIHICRSEVDGQLLCQ